MPAVNQPIMHDVGYHMRDGKHDVTAFDWDQYLAFADLHWGAPPKPETQMRSTQMHPRRLYSTA